MKELIPMDEYGVFADKKDTARVDSRFVAQFFEKTHAHLLRDIAKITESNSGLSENFVETNFFKDTYKDSTGRTLPCYAMTRDGFTILAMGFTGKKALQFKELYMRRFNDMEKFIKVLVDTRADFPKLTRQIQLLHPDAKPYHCSNECDMLNRIVLGMTAKQFRELHGIPKGESIRPYLRDDQVAMLNCLQDIDYGLLLGVPDYQQRKRQLEWWAVNNAGSYGTTKESVALLMASNEETQAIEGECLCPTM